jgi:hypothetical protein
MRDGGQVFAPSTFLDPVFFFFSIPLLPCIPWLGKLSTREYTEELTTEYTEQEEKEEN